MTGQQQPGATGPATDSQSDRGRGEIRFNQTERRPVRCEAPPPRPSIRRDPPPVDPALVPTDDILRLRLAEELEYARRMLDLLGDELAADHALVGRHSSGLQSIDIVGQILGHIANVVRSSEPEAAIERIGMADLKARLKRTAL